MGRKIEVLTAMLVLCISAKSAAAPGFTAAEGRNEMAPQKPVTQKSSRVLAVQEIGAVQQSVANVSRTLSLEDLDILVSRNQVVIDDPQGGELVLTLRAVEIDRGIQILRVATNDGEPGIITRRGNRYYATIATRRGTYAISHENGHTQVQSQEQLNLRIIPSLKDYALPPS